MSLLMDALKRAELAKQEAARAQFGIPPNTPSESKLSLEPISSDKSGAPTNPLPDLASYIDAVDADLASTPLPHATSPDAQPAAPPTPRNQPVEQSNRDSIRNAFAAKQPVASPPSRLPLWLALGTLGVAGLSIGAYVWYQLNAMNRGSLAHSAPPATSLPAPTTQGIQPAIAAPPPPAAPASPDSTLFAPRHETPPAPNRIVEAAPPDAAPIRLTRTRPEADPALSRGHARLQGGELDSARRDYEQVLQHDNNNTDALLALAAIAQRQGRTGDAEALRQRAWVANPSDPATQAAVLGGSASDMAPQNTESRLKTLLSAQPESAALNFALGNLYARQNRWPEAQQVYFNAVAADGDNPDYLFNLAVSLDHLRQSRLAGEHYRMALEAAARRPAAFDRARVEKRLGELTPEAPR